MLGVILLIVGNMVLPWIPVVLVIVLIEAVFVLGIGLMLSVLNVYFRDVQHFVAIAAAGALLLGADRVPDHARAEDTRRLGDRRSRSRASTS